MRIGYSFWGYLGDRKYDACGQPVSTPDGNATYSWALVWEAVRRGHEVFPMQLDRDAAGWEKYGPALFASFSRRKRADAYLHLRERDTRGEALPELDLLLVEWRWPIPGRNTPDARGTPAFQPDLVRQGELLERYRAGRTSVVLWDLDHKLTDDDVGLVRPAAILETAVSPRSYEVWDEAIETWTGRQAARVEPPFVVDDLMQHQTFPANRGRLMVYVGSRYERDDQIDRWIGPLREATQRRVHFYGNWTREPCLSECRARWPGVQYHDRIGVVDFREAYERAACVPLLSKASYAERGFVTPRPVEALLFGSLPVGLAGHLGIGAYCSRVARDPRHLAEVAEGLAEMTVEERHVEREELAHRLRRVDASRFVDALERCV